MRRWRRSKGIRTFLFCILFAGIFADVLAGMYMNIGREFADFGGQEQRDFFISHDRTSQILDGYIRLFEEYMQIAGMITEDGEIDYDREILVSYTDDEAYTIKELLKNSPTEGVGSGMFRDFMKEFQENCAQGISYPWRSRFALACDTRVIIDGDRIFSFVSPNAKSRTPNQVKHMYRQLENMYATSTDDETFEDDFRDSLSVSVSDTMSWKYQFHANSVYEEYLITYYPAYARCYFLDKVVSSYEQQGQELFLAAYRSYQQGEPQELLTQREFCRKLEEETARRREMISEREIPWRIHVVPRTMREAKKYVTFLVETYQELKYLFSQGNFIFAYENSSNHVMTNRADDWQKIKSMLDGTEKLQKATDQSDITFIYYNSRSFNGIGNFPRDTLPMSGNIIEKITAIGKNYGGASYQIAVGLNVRNVMEGEPEDEFVLQYREMVEKSRWYHFGEMLLRTGSVVLVLAFLLLCIRCGSPVDEGEEKESLYWFDRIWLEVQILLCYLMGGITVWVLKMWNGFLIHPMIILCAAAVALLLFGCLRILLSVIKRAKLNCGGQYSMILLFVKEVVWKKSSLKGFISDISYRMAFVPARRKFGFLLLAEMALLAYYGCSAVYVSVDRQETVFSYMTSAPGVIGIVFGFIFLVILFFWQKNIMNDQEAENQIISAMRQIISGDFSYQIPEKDTMSLRVRELVRAVNQMGNVVESAVEESVKSERMKTELIANVSHDIKTPLTSIINYVDLLQGEEIRNPKVQKYISVLENKSQRLKVLMEDLIEASKASSGVMELEIHPLDFRELVWQTNGEFEERFAECNLELVADIPAESMMFEGDGRRVFRILENLYSNVAKYAMEHTRVYVSLERAQGSLVFTMKNVSAEKLNITPEELTERFVRGDHARSTEGSGLGLSIAKSLTELMGGQFVIELDGDLFCGKIVFPEMTEEQMSDILGLEVGNNRE